MRTKHLEINTTWQLASFRLKSRTLLYSAIMTLLIASFMFITNQVFSAENTICQWVELDGQLPNLFKLLPAEMQAEWHEKIWPQFASEKRGRDKATRDMDLTQKHLFFRADRLSARLYAMEIDQVLASAIQGSSKENTNPNLWMTVPVSDAEKTLGTSHQSSYPSEQAFLAECPEWDRILISGSLRLRILSYMEFIDPDGNRQRISENEMKKIKKMFPLLIKLGKKQHKKSYNLHKLPQNLQDKCRQVLGDIDDEERNEYIGKSTDMVKFSLACLLPTHRRISIDLAILEAEANKGELAKEFKKWLTQKGAIKKNPAGPQQDKDVKHTIQCPTAKDFLDEPEKYKSFFPQEAPLYAIAASVLVGKTIGTNRLPDNTYPPEGLEKFIKAKKWYKQTLLSGEMHPGVLYQVVKGYELCLKEMVRCKGVDKEKIVSEMSEVSSLMEMLINKHFCMASEPNGRDITRWYNHLDKRLAILDEGDPIAALSCARPLRDYWTRVDSPGKPGSIRMNKVANARLTNEELSELRDNWIKDDVMLKKVQHTASLIVYRFRHQPETMESFINKYSHREELVELVDGARVILIAHRAKKVGSM